MAGLRCGRGPRGGRPPLQARPAASYVIGPSFLKKPRCHSRVIDGSSVLHPCAPAPALRCARLRPAVWAGIAPPPACSLALGAKGPRGVGSAHWRKAFPRVAALKGGRVVSPSAGDRADLEGRVTAEAVFLPRPSHGILGSCRSVP